MQRLVERPEALWAMWAGIVGALAAAGWSSYRIFAEGSAAAGLSFVFVPLVAAVVALPAGVWGAAVGHVVLHLRGRAEEPRIVFWSAVAAALMPPAVLAWELLHR